MTGPKIDTFLTYEQASRLRELGYNEQTYFFYSRTFCVDGTPIVVHKGFVMPCTNREMEKMGDNNDISAPTQAQATKWLREKGWSVRINFIQDTKEWFYDVLNLETGFYSDSGMANYSTYEDAMSAGIDDVIGYMEGGV